MNQSDIFSKMRQNITFQSESTSTDSGGGTSLSWVSGSTVWAEVKPISRFSEKFKYGQLEDSLAFRITTRYISGITPKMRILFGSRVFNIRNVVNLDERSEILEILAEEGVAI
jgi:SPP1 family predicted phage head-tail adaptor